MIEHAVGGRESEVTMIGWKIKRSWNKNKKENLN